MLDDSTYALFGTQPNPHAQLLAGAATWHRNPKPGRPHVLPVALDAAHRAAPHLDSLAKVLLPRLPCGILSSSTIKAAIEGEPASSRVRSLDAALSHQWTSWNTDKWINTETADCDDCDWDERLDELQSRYGLPEPLTTCISPWKSSAHLTWLYDSPVNTEDPEQARLRRGVRKGLIVALRSDARFGNRLQKNPWHVARSAVMAGSGKPGNWLTWEAYEASGATTTYHTITPAAPKPIALLDLFRPLAAFASERGITLLQPREGSTRPVFVRTPTAGPTESKRGSKLFDTARVRVYRACTADLATIRSIIGRAAAELGSPAAQTQIDEITASISRFMREDWTGPLDGKPGARSTRDVDHGVLTREAVADGRLHEWEAMSATERRIEAAKRSAARNRATTVDAIRTAFDGIQAAGGSLLQVEIARRAGVSIRTLKRYWHELSPLKTKVPNGPNPPVPPSGTLVPPLQAKNPSPSPSLASLAAADRKIRATVARLAAVAEAAMKPGALPPRLPEIPADLSGSPPVRTAAAKARQAVQDAKRRADARAAKAAADRRAVEFKEAAGRPFPWTWWTDYRVALDAEWDAREQEPGLDRYALAAIRASREATFAARWRLWRKVTGPQPVPLPPAESRSARVARMAREDAESMADLDRFFGPDILSTD